MAKYRVETDKGVYEIETDDAPQVVPGTEKLGGAPPPMGGDPRGVDTSILQGGPQNIKDEAPNQGFWSSLAQNNPITGAYHDLSAYFKYGPPAKRGDVPGAMATPLHENPVTAPLAGMVQQLQHGDTGGAAGTAAGAYGIPAAMGLAVRGAQVGKAKLAEKFNTVDPTKAMEQAIRPSGNIDKFRDNIERAMPLIKQETIPAGAGIESATSVESLRRWVELADEAKSKAIKEWEAQRGPGEAKVPLAQLMFQAAKRGDTAAATAIKGLIDEYGYEVPLSTVEKDLQHYNAKLEGYYAKFPRAAKIAKEVNPETAADSQAANARRRVIAEYLDEGGTAPSELRQRYGALSALQEQARKRLTIVERQAPVNLNGQMTMANAVGNAASSVYMMARHPYWAMFHLLDGAAKAKGASLANRLNSPDFLVQRAMENWKTLPENVNFKGFTPAAPLTPPPASTGVGPFTPAPINTSDLVRQFHLTENPKSSAGRPILSNNTLLDLLGGDKAVDSAVQAAKKRKTTAEVKKKYSRD